MTVSVSTSIPETAFNRRTVEGKPLTNDIQLANQIKLNLGAGQKEEHNVQKIEEKQPELSSNSNSRKYQSRSNLTQVAPFVNITFYLL